MHFRRNDTGSDGKHRDMDDYHGERFERAHLHRAILGKLSKTIHSAPYLHCNGGCGQEKDSRSDGAIGLRNPRVGYARNGDRACGPDARADHYVFPIIPECAAFERTV
jgi:hypothetical protein